MLCASREECTTCRRADYSLLRYIEQDREIMTCAARENKEMKNFMAVGKLFVEGVEHDPGVELAVGASEPGVAGGHLADPLEDLDDRVLGGLPLAHELDNQV